MVYKNQAKNNEVKIYLDAKLFSKDSVFKCLYWYGNKYHTNFSLENPEKYCITIKPMSNDLLDDITLEGLLLQVEKDLIDFNLRDIVTKETQNLRDLLIAKAFSNGEFDELPIGEISDPVGFSGLSEE